MQVSIDGLAVAENSTRFGAIDELAISTIVLTTLITGIGTASSRFFRLRPADRHTILLSSLVLSVFLPGALYIGHRFGPISLPQIQWANHPTNIVTGTPLTNCEVVARQDVGGISESPSSFAKDGHGGKDSSVVNPETIALNLEPAVTVEQQSIPDAFDARSLPASANNSTFTNSMILWIVYLAVVTGLLSRSLISFARLIWLERFASQACDEFVQIASKNAESLGLCRTPRVLFSDQVRVPISIARRNQTIILPSSVAGLLPERADVVHHVLRHELAHLKRRDQCIIFLQTVLRIIYWPIPTIHLASSALSRAREEICDRIAAGENIVGYGRTLLLVAEQIINADLSDPISSAGFARGAKELQQRVATLVDPAVDRRTESSSRCRATVATVAALMTVSISSLRMSNAETQVNEESASATMSFLEPLDEPAIIPATEQARKSSAIPYYRRPLAPAIYTRKPLPLPASASPQFSGKVVDSQGKPIVGAKIYAVPLSLLNQPLGPNSVTSTPFRYPRPLIPTGVSVGPVRAETKRDGTFAFDAGDVMVIAADGQPALPRVRLFATADHYGPDTIRISVGTSVKTPPVTFRLQRDDVPIRGRLLDATGAPLRDADVLLDRIAIPSDFNDYFDRLRAAFPTDGGPTPRSTISSYWDIPGMATRTRTDANGRFEFTGVGRDRFVSFYAFGVGIKRTRLEVVSRRREDWPDVSEKYQARLEQARAMAKKLGYNPRRFVMSASDDGQWQLMSSPIIRGRVVDRQTGRGVPGMLVGANASKGPDTKQASWRSNLGVIHVRSDSEGRFEFTVPGGLYPQATHLAITTRDAPGGTHFGGTVYVPISTRQQLDKLSNLQIKVDRGIPYKVRVTNDAGQPIRGVEMFASSLPTGDVEAENRKIKLKRQSLPAIEIKPGVYSGLVFSRRSLLFVNAPNDQNYRGAYLDESLPYVDENHVRTANGNRPMRDYDAIIPMFDEQSIDAPAEADIELSVRLQRQSPLMLRLVRTDGTLVRNATTRGFDLSSAPVNPIVRDGTIAVHALHPKRKHTFRFEHKELDLIGQTTVDGSMTGPIDVLMQSPGRAEARLVNEDGTIHTNYSKISFVTDDAAATDSSWGLKSYTKVRGGKIALDGLVPGQRYRFRATKAELGNVIDGFMVKPGETKMLGDVVWKPKK